MRKKLENIKESTIYKKKINSLKKPLLFEERLLRTIKVKPFSVGTPFQVQYTFRLPEHSATLEGQEKTVSCGQTLLFRDIKLILVKNKKLYFASSMCNADFQFCQKSSIMPYITV